MRTQTTQKRVKFARALRMTFLRVFAVIALIFASSLFLFNLSQPNTAHAAPTLNFQARLQSSTGAIADDGLYNVEFKLYDASTGGTNLWTETYYDSNGATAGNDNRIRVANGYLTVNLGSITALPTSINWDQDLYLTMNIGGITQTATPVWDGEMDPRLKLTAVPYAMQAESASQLEVLQGANSGTLIFDTLTADRNILLPDEDGTICLQNSTNCGFLTGAAANGAYIQDGTALQTANFNIQGAANSSPVAKIDVGSSTGNILEVGDGAFSGFTVVNSGQTEFFGDVTFNGFASFEAGIDAGLAGPLEIGYVSGGVATSINLNQNVVVAAGETIQLVGGATSLRPVSPAEGMIYFDSQTDELLLYANGTWQALNGSGGATGDGKTATMIVAASNSPQSIKDVADYVADGEIGDGQTTLDGDQIEINQALTAAAGGYVYLAEGTYVADATILVPNNTTLAGAGSGSVIEWAAITSYDEVIKNLDTTTGTGIVIRDLSLNGREDITTSTQYGIVLEGMGGGTGSTLRKGATIRNVTIKNMSGRPFSIEGSSNHNTIVDSHILNNGDAVFISGNQNAIRGNTVMGSSGDGLTIMGSHHSVAGNLFESNTDGGLVILGASSTVTGNIFASNGSGIEMDGATGNTISSNEFTGHTFMGIEMDGASDRNIITSNNIDSISAHGIYINASADNTVTGNSIHNTGLSPSYGIWLLGASNTVVSDNRISNTGGDQYGRAIYLDNSDFNTLTGNAVTDTSATTTNYAINISNSTSDTNYLADNSLGGGSINDLGTGTIYAGQTNANGYFIFDSASTRLGLGTDSPAYMLDVAGDINTTTGYRINGTLGASTTCTGGQVMQDIVVQGGIVTGGTCVAGGGGTGVSSLNSLTGALVIQGNAQIAVDATTSPNINLSIQGDSIGDTQLAFNTGQHLTTTSSPTFASQTLTGTLTVQGTGASTIAGSLAIGAASPNSTLTVQAASGEVNVLDVLGASGETLLKVKGSGTSGWSVVTAAAGWVDRSDFVAMEFKGKMWVMGGATGSFFPTYLNDVWSSTDGVTWTQETSNAGWAGRTSAYHFVYDDKMWIAGGYNGSSVLDDVWYTSDGVNWTQATAAPGWSPRSDGGSVVFDNKMWMLGGYTGSTNDEVWYSSDGVNWTLATAAPGWAARSDMENTVLNYNGKMWMIAGSTTAATGGVQDDVWSSTDGVTWTQETAASGFAARFDAVGTVFNGKMWIMGGQNSGGTALNDVWSSTDGITWTSEGSAAWSGRRTFDGFAFDNGIYIMGGQNGAGRLNSVWRYSLGTRGIGIGTSSTAYTLNVGGALRLQPSAEPPSAAAGLIYFDSTTNKFRCSEDGETYVDCISSGGSGVTTVGALEGGTPNANGATIVGSTMYLQSASTSFAGLVNTGVQSFAGDKTFTGVTNFDDSVVIGQSGDLADDADTSLTVGNSTSTTVDTTVFQVLSETGSLAYYHNYDLEEPVLTLQGYLVVSPGEIGNEGIVADFNGRVMGADAVNDNEFVTLGQLNTAIGGVGGAGVSSLNSLTGALVIQGNAQIAVDATTSPNINLSIQGDSIGDTQLAFNTGQHLTTASSPTFGSLNVNGNIVAIGSEFSFGGTTGESLISSSCDPTFGCKVTISDGSESIVLDEKWSTIDILASAVGIGAFANPSYGLHVDSDINAVQGYYFNGTAGASTTCTGGQVLQDIVVQGGIVTGGTCASAGTTYDGTDFIVNGTALQTGNFNIQSAAATSVTARIQGHASQTANVLEVVGENGNGLTVAASGSTSIYTVGYPALTVTSEFTSSPALAAHGVNGPAAQFTSGSGSASIPVLITKQSGVSTSDLLQAQDSAGAALFSVSSTGLVDSVVGYSFNGTLGASTTCTGGQVLQDIVVQGGIVTGGTCVAGGGGTGVSSLNSLTGALVIQGNAQIAVDATTSPNINLSIQSNSIGDAQLVYDTGQHLTTASSPAFNDLRVSDTAEVDWLRVDRQMGSAALPNINFGPGGQASSEDTGIFYTGSSSVGGVGLSAEGVEVLRADANGNVGINQPSPSYQLDVVGDINTTTGYRVGGTLGASTTCTGGQVMQDIVVQGGIVTGGTCVAGGGGTGVSSLNSLTGALVIQGNAQIAVDATTSPNINLSIQGDSIGDTQLAFNTGQHLTTTSSPTFAALIVNGNIDAQTGTITSFSSVTVTSIVGTTAATGQLWLHDGNGQKVILQTADQTQDVTLTIPAAGATDTICLQTLANCAGTGDGGVTTVGVLEGGTANANGATISGTTIYLQSATENFAGLVNTTAQTFAGDKTFSGDIAAEYVTVNQDLIVMTFASFNDDADFYDRASFNGTVPAVTNDALVSIGGALQGGNASGTYLGMNAASGYTGDLLNFQKGGSSLLQVLSSGQLIGYGGITAQGFGLQADTIDSAGGATLNIGDSNGQATAISLNQNITVAAQKTITMVGGLTSQRPASPSEGMIYFDSETDELLVYAAGTWQVLNSTGGTGDGRTATMIVAASDSPQVLKDAADYVANGEIGDGQTTLDGDQIEINQALTAAAGGYVYLAEGTYVADATILIPNNTTLAGAGQGTVIELADLTGVSDNLIENSVTAHTGITIQDLVLDGRSDLNTAGSQSGINLSGSGGTTPTLTKIHNITAKNFRSSGIGTQLGFNSSSLTDSVFMNNGSGAHFGNGTNNSTFTSNIFKDNSGNGLGLDDAYNSVFTSNIFENNSGDGLQLGQSSNNVVSSNMFYNNGANGMEYYEGAGGDIITGNSFSSNGDAVGEGNLYLNNDSIFGDTAATVTNNVFNGGYHAILIDSSMTDTYLSGNRFKGTFTGGAINDQSTSTIYAGQQNANGYFIFDSASARLGLGTASPAYMLDVAGDINTSTGYRVGGVLGTSTTCSGGDFLQDAVIQGGIITSVTCATGAGGGSGVASLNGQTGAITLQGTTNQVTVGTVGDIITLTTPQDINTTANVTFGSLTIGSGGNTITLADTGIVLAGTARNTETIVIAPEFPNAVFTADGTNNVGFMTTDYVSGLAPAEGNKHTYYAWATDQTVTPQDYDITMLYQLPSNFDANSLTNFSMWVYADNTTNASVSYEIADVDGDVCSSGSLTLVSASTWEQKALNTPSTTSPCAFAANDLITITITPSSLAPQTDEVKIGELQFDYEAKF